MLKDSILSHVEKEKTMYLGLRGMEVFKGGRGHDWYILGQSVSSIWGLWILKALWEMIPCLCYSSTPPSLHFPIPRRITGCLSPGQGQIDPCS